MPAEPRVCGAFGQEVLPEQRPRGDKGGLSKGRVQGDEVSEVSRGQVVCSFWVLFQQPWGAAEGCLTPLGTVCGVEQRGPELWASVRRERAVARLGMEVAS